MDLDITTVGTRRQNAGVEGTKIRVTTNNFKIGSLPKAQFYHYQVDIEPEGFMAARNLEIISQLQDRIEPMVFNPKGVYDGKKTFYIAKDLGAKKVFPDIFASSTTAAAQGGQVIRNRRTYTVSFTRVGFVDNRALDAFVRGEGTVGTEGLKLIHALNLLLRMSPLQGMKRPTSGSVFFDGQSKQIGGGLSIVKGLYQSVRPGVGSMLVNIDVALGLVYQSGPLIDICLKFLESSNVADLQNNRLTGDRRNKLKRFLKGVQVVPDYGNRGQARPIRPKSISGIGQYSALEHRFDRDGVETTVAEYYKERHNISLRYGNLICVKFGRDNVFPIEICNVVPNQLVPKRTKLTPRQQDEVLRESTQTPRDRLNTIMSNIGRLSHQQSDYVMGAGVVIEDRPMETDARLLQAPEIRFKDSGLMPQRGRWNLTGAPKFVTAAAVGGWAIVNFDNHCSLQTVQNIAVDIYQACTRLGMRFAYTDPPISEGNPSGNIPEIMMNAGRTAVAQAGSRVPQLQNQPPDLILCILPPSATHLRNAIKFWGDTTTGVPTQIILGPASLPKNLRSRGRGGFDRHDNQYINNLALKLNAKRGGVNIIPDKNSVPFLVQKKTIIFGADVSHGSPGQKTPSFAAVVGSMDRPCALYSAQCSLQPAREESIVFLKDMIKSLLEAYRRYWGEERPVVDSVIFFRDGVSEGQFTSILEGELGQIEAAFLELGLVKPKITFVVVGKKHHFRMFPKNAGPKDNCPSGTVVDSQVVNPYFQDFYLQSHAGILGTSRPSHYTVLHDDNRFSADSLQRLSFVMCHVYSRATTAVSIPAPVYYADLVSRRLAFHLDSSKLETLTSTSDEMTLDDCRNIFSPVHHRMVTNRYMYWM